ncbi:MAG: non-ribosomal peptide synthetase, partial [Leptolyngbya foveolarum]
MLPVSSAQQRLWFLDQLDPGNPAYNLPVAVRLIGPLNVTALEKSFQGLIQRHEILRSTLTLQNQQPVQVVHDKRASSAFHLTVLDLRGEPRGDTPKDTDTDPRLQAVLSKAIRQPFDLSSDHLLRGTLIQRHDNEHILLLVMHHIIADDWSMGVLVQELATLYPALAANQPITLPDLPIQYADFAVWQQQQLQSGQLQPQLDYWTQQLADLTPLQLPSARARPNPPSRQGAKQTWTLSPQLTTALRHLSQKTDVTLFMLLLGAFKTLLYRYTGCPDVVVGSPIANRNQPEIQTLIGFFVNTLVLRSHLQPDLTFLNLLSQIRETTLEAYEHQDLPFEKLVEALHPDRSLHQPPLFQVWFALHNAPLPDLNMGPLTLEPLSLQPDTVQFDLSLEVMESPETLTVAIEYDLDLFDAPTIGRWFEHWQTLLTGIVAHPEQPLSELPLLPATEQHQVLVEWNKTQRNYAQVGCFHHLFEQQVKKSPRAIALVFEDQQLTYQDLNQQANQLAHYLQTLGVESGTLVGFCLERSPAMLISLLAILKAGGAYVPLDPSYPVERLRFMLQDSQIEVLVTQQHLAVEPPISTPNVIILERDQAIIAQHSPDNLKTEVTPDHLAYVIYTSGSTGQPKGVMIEHRALMNFTLAATEVYEIEASDRILQFASISFDTAAEEIFPALTQGSTLVLRTEAMLHSFSEFLAACQVAEITVLDLPTAFWQQMVIELTAKRASLPMALRLIIIGGEAVSPQAVADWQQIGAGVRLVNSYGPTETTVVAMVHDLSRDLSHDLQVSSTAPVAIGRPLPNVQSYVLDAAQKPVPIGIPGELYIGGKGLARGYLNRPNLSAERFIRNPVIEVLSDLQVAEGDYLYRTGDRVRYRADGNLEFLGRLDDQVKIRGYRVELGEIEAVLQQHPTVQNAVVMLREDSPGQKRLAAYIVLHQALKPADSLEAFVEK